MSSDGGQTPYGNTGSTNTNTGQILLGIDTLEWTAGEGSRLLQVLPEVGGLEAVPVGHGLRGYRQVEQVAGIKILFDGGSAGMGRHYIVGGEALRGLESSFGVSPDVLLGRVLEVHQGHVTRLDIAVDAVNLGIHRGLIQEVYDRGGVLSRLRRWRELCEKDMVGNYKPGWSFYVGARDGGGTEVNIYDKRAEQIAKGNSAVSMLEDWVRFEWRIGKKHAGQFAGVLLSGDMGELRGLLTGLLDFVERGSDANKSRCTRVGWYQDIMGGMKRGRLLMPEREWSWVESREWMFDMAAKTYYKVWRAMGVNQWQLQKMMLDAGRSRMTDRDWEELKELGVSE